MERSFLPYDMEKFAEYIGWKEFKVEPFEKRFISPVRYKEGDACWIIYSGKNEKNDGSYTVTIQRVGTDTTQGNIILTKVRYLELKKIEYTENCGENKKTSVITMANIWERYDEENREVGIGFMLYDTGELSFNIISGEITFSVEHPEIEF